MFYIYRITNIVNNKTYIGRSNHSSIKRDNEYFGSGPLIKKAIRKYGKSFFRKTIIIDGISTKERIIEIEENIISLYKRHNKAEYNLMTKGYGNDITYLNFKGKKHTEEFKLYISKKLKGIKRGPLPDWRKKQISNWDKKHSVFIYNNPSVKGMKWYTNGEKDIFLSPDKIPPHGYIRGRSKLKNKGLKA